MKGDLVIGKRSFVGGSILDMQGDLTKATEERLLNDWDWKDPATNGPNVILNFTAVSYINSAGIATLIRVAQTATRSGIILYAFGISGHYQKMFRLIGLNELMMIYPDEYSLMLRFQ